MPLSPQIQNNMIKSILDYALDYQSRGFSVVPLRTDGAKCPPIRWKEFQTRRATEQEILAWWVKWPNSNVGIVTGSASGIFVIDADSEEGGKWVAANLPVTSVYAKTGRKKGVHAYYRLPAGVTARTKVRWQPDVDLKADGGLVVAPPSIHHSGVAYEFVFPAGLDGWNDLAEFDPNKFRSAGNLNINLSQVLLPGESTPPAQDGSRHSAMMKLIGVLVAEGNPLNKIVADVSKWNRGNKPPIEEKEIPVACQNIWNAENGSVAAILSTPIISAPTENQPKTFRSEFPRECLAPGGLIQKIMDCVDRGSAKYQPIFGLAGAIAFVGHLCGQRIMTETGLRTNLYTISIGFSGCGKTAPHSILPVIASTSTARISMGPTDTASGAAILRWLSTDNHQVSFFALDEIGLMLKGLKNPASPLAEMPRILIKLYSETNHAYVKSYADAKLNITLPYHHLSLHGSSTPGEFWGNLTEADTVSGFLARILIFEASDRIEKKEKTSVLMPAEVTGAINSLWGISTPIDKERGDIARVPIPFVVPRSKATKEIFSPWEKKYEDMQYDYREDESKSAVFARAGEHAAKLALIHAASLHGPGVIEKEVEPESMIWATSLVDYCICTLLTGIKKNIAKNQFHAEQQKVMKFIRDSGKKEMPFREIYKKLHMPAKMANDILQSLFISGELRQEDRPNKQNRMVPFVVIEQPA